MEYDLFYVEKAQEKKHIQQLHLNRTLILLLFLSETLKTMIFVVALYMCASHSSFFR